MKSQVLESMGFSVEQQFPVYADRMPTQLLAYLRMARVQDPALLAKVCVCACACVACVAGSAAPPLLASITLLANMGGAALLAVYAHATRMHTERLCVRVWSSLGVVRWVPYMPSPKELAAACALRRAAPTRVV